MSIGFVTKTLETPKVIQMKAKAGESIVNSKLSKASAYVYGVVWVVIGILGMVFQFWMKSKSDDKEAEEKREENNTAPMI